MIFDYFIADPAGNITAFVWGKPHKEAAAKLLIQNDLRIEQVAFLETPCQGGHIKCTMSGDEFCGNACRAAGYYYALSKNIQQPATVMVEMSGCGGIPVAVSVDTAASRAFARMPLPQGMRTINWSGLSFDAVIFDGIIHIIAPADNYEKLDMSREEMHRLCVRLHTAALGVMFLGRDLHLKPLVWVDQVGSLVWESSCGSGSSACAWWLSREMEQGIREYRFMQPGGTLEIRIERSETGCTLMMGGAVCLLNDPLWRKLEL